MNAQKKITCAFLLLFLISITTYADLPDHADWKDIGIRSIDNDLYLVDINSLHRKGNLLGAWIAGKTSSGSHISHYSINCPTKQYVWVELHTMTEEGKYVAVKWPDSGRLESVGPDSVLEGIVMKLCSATALRGQPKIPRHIPYIIMREE